MSKPRSLFLTFLAVAVVATALLPGAAVANHNCTPTLVNVATHPNSQTITYGDNVTFTASANANPAATVQWQTSTNGGGAWSNIVGATSTTLNVTKPPVSSPAVQYRAVFTQGCHQNPTATTNAATLTVNQKELTVTGVTASNKVYTATTAATVNTAGATLNGVISPDTVSLGTAFASGTFADKNVGDDKTVQIAGLTISGSHAPNYTLTQPTTTADITEAGLTVTGVTAANRPYDTTTDATVDSASAALNGVLGSDVVSLNGSPTTGSFADKNVGDDKPVTVTGFSISNTDAGNYTLTQPTPTADITPAGLTVTGVTAADRPYDTTTDASVNSGAAALSGVLGSDVVTLNGAPSSGSFADKSVGDDKPVTVTGFSISDTDAGNYTLTQPTPTADITPAGLTVTGVTAQNRVYDATADATVDPTNAALNGVLGSDVVTLNGSPTTGSFADKNVGDDKPVTVTGFSISNTDAGNYTLTQPTPTADITPAGLTVTGVTAADRPYDTTSDASVNSGAAALSGVLGSDVVTLNGSPTTGSFADKNVGDDKPVTVTGFSISNTDAGNYTLTQPTPTADITAVALTIDGVGAQNKVYDALTGAMLTGVDTATLNGVLGSDTVNLGATGVSGAFADKNVDDDKPVTVTGFTKSGADAGNYTLTQPTPTADITEAGLTVTGVTAADRPYDTTSDASVNSGSAALGGVLGSDAVTLNGAPTAGSFADKTVGDDKPVTVTGFSITGTDAGNYTLAQPTPTADITPAGLTVTGVTAQTRVYDATTDASVDSAAATLNGVLGSDVVTLNGSPTTGSFADKNVGDDKPVTVTGFSISNTDAGNYTLTQPTPSADITPADVTGSFDAQNKVYDGTTAATATNRTVDGELGTDVVTLNGAATFANANVGNTKTVTIATPTLGGADGGNYQLTLLPITDTANITAKSVTGSFTAANKAYNGSSAATVASRSLNGEVAGDDVSLSGGSASFANPNVGNNKTVTLSGASLDGADEGNYTLGSVSTDTANITAKSVTGQFTAADKTFDGTKDATITGRSLTGAIAGDDVSLSGGVAGFVNEGPGEDITVLGFSFTLAGADAGNYSLSSVDPTAATIQREPGGQENPPTEEDIEEAASDKLGGDVKPLGTDFGGLAFGFAPEDQGRKLAATKQPLFAIGCLADCDVNAKKTVVLTTGDGDASAAATKKLRLKAQNISLAEGEVGVIKLKLSKKQKRKIKKANKAKLIVKTTVESAGETATGKKTYRLKT